MGLQSVATICFCFDDVKFVQKEHFLMNKPLFYTFLH